MMKKTRINSVFQDIGSSLPFKYGNLWKWQSVLSLLFVLIGRGIMGCFTKEVRICLWGILFAFGMSGMMKGQTINWTDVNLQPNDHMNTGNVQTDYKCYKISQNGTYYLDGMTQGQIVLTRSNLKNVIIKVKGSNTLTSRVVGSSYQDSYGISGLDLDNFSNKGSASYNTGNTVTLELATGETSATIKATGAGSTVGKIAGIKFMSTIFKQTVNNNLTIKGRIAVNVKGCEASSDKLVGIGGQSYMDNAPGGVLKLSGGASVTENGYEGEIATNQGDEINWFPSVEIIDYGTYDQSNLKSTSRKNTKIDGTLETFIYKTLPVPDKGRWIGVSPNGRGSDYQIYTNTNNNRIFFYRSSTSTSGDWASNAAWDYIKIGNIPSGIYDASGRNMGVAYDQSQSYFESLDGTFTANSLTLNTNNYPHSGTLIANNANGLVFDGAGKTLISDKDQFAFTGTEPLKLSDVKLSGIVKITGKVYVDPSKEGNLTNWATQNTSGGAIRYCVATLPNNTAVTGLKVGSTPITDYHQDGTSLYFWTTQSSSLQTFTVTTATSEYIAKATPQNQNTSVDFSLIVAKIGTTPYLTLADAFNAVKGGETILLQQDYTLPNNTKLTLPSAVTLNQVVTLDLNGKTLTSSSGSEFNGGAGVLKIKNDSGSGGLSGSFSIAGCLYSEIITTATFTDASSGNRRYRVNVKNLPKNTGQFLTYSGGGGITKAYYDSTNGACLWLPGTDSPTSFSIYENGEQFAHISKRVEMNHNNEVTDPYPYVDIQYGDITVTPQATNQQKVVYGTKKYEAIVDSKPDNRLPIYGTAAGSGKNNAITVASATTNKAFLTLAGVNIHPQSKAALTINGHADIELSGMNYLHGGTSGSTIYPAVTVAGNITLDWNNHEEGDGYFSAVGGYAGGKTSPAIKAESGATMIIKNGTYSILRSKGDAGATLAPENSIDGGTQYIYAGSVNAGYTDASRPKNQGGETIYKTTISTNLKKWQVYKCEYTGSSSNVPSLAMPDEALKFYCWLKPYRVDQPHSKVEFWDKAGNPINPPVEVPEVGTHDQNAAPVAVTLIDKSGKVPNVSFGTLQEAFQAMAQGGDYRLLLLINIYGLNTTQEVPENTKVAMDLQGFVLGHDAVALYDASNTGAYLYMYNGGDMENQFHVAGDVFIAGNVPLTHATVRKNGTAVYRTLISGLREDDKHLYSFYNQQDVPFKLHDGLACLWLPYGQDEVRIKEGGGPEPIEYTTGVITTGIHQPDVTPARTVGTVAIMTGTDKDGKSVNKSYKNLKLAFEDAATLAGTDAEKLTIQLLAGVSFSSTQPVSGAFTIDLSGKNLSAPSGAGKLDIAAGADIRIVDRSAGMKGKLQTDMDLAGNAKLFVSGAIQIEGTVKAKGNDDVLWRTLVDMSYQDGGVKTVTYASQTYPVVESSLCLWLKEGGPSDYIFTIGVKNETVKNQTISKNHMNDMTIGGGDFAARTGGATYEKVEGAFAAVAEDQTVELLKTSPLVTSTTLGVSSTLELGKYGLVANQASNAATLTVKKDVQLTVRSTAGSGQMTAPIILADDGLMYIGADVQQIGQVKNGSGVMLYRLLVNQLPNSIPDGVHEYTYDSGIAAKCLVRNHTACLWLPKSDPKKLTFTLNGTEYATNNVGIRENHANTQTYGVNDVAEVWGVKYSTLSAAFQNAAGGTVLLLKDASVDAEINVSGNVTLDMAGYGITSSDNRNLFIVAANNNLQIVGKGSVAADFKIVSVADGTTYSNGNLQVASGVYLGSSKVELNSTPAFRVIVNGDYPINTELDYSYTDKQEGHVRSSIKDKPLCLWMANENTPSSFFVMQGDNTWQAPSVVIVSTHANVLTVTPVGAVAGIGVNDVYGSLIDAFKVAKDKDVVKLLHNVSNLSGEHKLAASSGIVTFDLQKLKIESKDASFNANGATLVVENGTLNGNIKFDTDKIFMKGSLQMGNTFVTDKDGHTVWRVLLKLPAGTTTLTYELGSSDVTSTNIQEIDGYPVACLWLPSSNQVLDFVVKVSGTEYVLRNVLITSSHGNELDLTNTDPVAATDGKDYASLTTAFAAAAEGGIVTLKKELLLSSVQSVGDKNVTLDLDGNSITSTNGGFSVGGTNKKLTVKNGILSGTLRVGSEIKTVAIDQSVSIAGFVLDKDNKPVYRTLVKVGPAALSASAECLWIYPKPLSFDLEIITSSTDKYEATIPANYTDQNTEVTAYKRVDVSAASANWDANYANTNLVLAANVVLDAASASVNPHRLTIKDGAKVTTASTTAAMSTEGIRYVRTFAASGKWESISLPFTAMQIIATPEGQTDPILLSPATAEGTAGHFWLATINSDGSLQDVKSPEMTANVAYLMAVPANLQGKEITFISAPNQMLYRNAVIGVQPTAGFASYANGTLGTVPIDDVFYVLDKDGKTFIRITTSEYASGAIPPFRGYLFADPATTTKTASFKVGGVPTGTEIPDVFGNDLKVSGGRGRLFLESDRAHQIYVYTMSGYCLRSFHFAGGRGEVTLPAGLYIVNGQKVIVRDN